MCHNASGVEFLAKMDQITLLAEIIFAPCHYNLESGIGAIFFVRLVCFPRQKEQCMLAGIELENDAIGREMSNRQSEKQSFPNSNLHRLGHTVGDLQLPSFTVARCMSCIRS